MSLLARKSELAPPSPAEINPWLVLLLAFSCGLVVANI